MPDGLIQSMHGLVQLGPPQFFEQDRVASSGSPVWLWLVSGLVLAALGVIVFRRLWRMRLSDERLAFVLMSRRLGLGRGHREAIERLAQRSGTDPIGLLMCESAFARAAAGERFADGGSVERKPVLLTGAELAELGSACEELFGPGAIERLQREPETDLHEEEASDANEQRGQWVA